MPVTAESALQARVEEGLARIDEHGREVPRIVGLTVRSPEKLALEKRLDDADTALLRSTVERVTALALKVEREIAALSCSGLDDVTAMQRCIAANVRRNCCWKVDDAVCAFARVAVRYEAARHNLAVANVPEVLARRVLAAMHGRIEGGRRVPPQPLEQRPSVQVVQSWLTGTPMPEPFEAVGDKWIVALQRHGAHSGARLAAAAALAKVGGHWVDVGELVGFRKAPGMLKGVAFDIDSVMTGELLVIDELGTETLTPWAKSQIYSVVRRRADKGRRVLLTTRLARRTGLPLQTFAGRYDGDLDALFTKAGAWFRLPAWNPDRP